MDIRGILGMDSDVRNGYDDIKVTFKIDADAPRKEIEAIVAKPAPLPARLPTRLELVDQGAFAIGYWQQRAARRSSTDKPIAPDATEKDAA
jgi:hypothetical protein